MPLFPVRGVRCQPDLNLSKRSMGSDWSHWHTEFPVEGMEIADYIDEDKALKKMWFMQDINLISGFVP